MLHRSVNITDSYSVFYIFLAYNFSD